MFSNQQNGNNFVQKNTESQKENEDLKKKIGALEKELQKANVFNFLKIIN